MSCQGYCTAWPHCVCGQPDLAFPTDQNPFIRTVTPLAQFRWLVKTDGARVLQQANRDVRGGHDIIWIDVPEVTEAQNGGGRG